MVPFMSFICFVFPVGFLPSEACPPGQIGKCSVMTKSALYLFRLSLLLSPALWMVCALPVRAGASPENLKVGFFLLHDVCHEESQVGLITMVKTTPNDVTDYVERISKLAKADLDRIDAVMKDKEALKLEDNPLPQFEQDVRSAIRADKEHQLLFGTKGEAFARALIVTQIEASNYISFITKTLADQDPSADDTRALLKMSSHWLKIRDEGFRLLAAR